MSKAKTVWVGLTVAAALLALGACQSVTPDEMNSLENRVAALESRANAAEARASQLEAAANQCTTTCQDVEQRAERMFQQSQMK
jgi:hypothetical protein